jgi:8-oxo-dGTP diphosphatase
MENSIPEFGVRIAGAEYHLRPGGYSVISSAMEIAVVATPGGWFLPGGGQLPDETPEQAAIREAREECGLLIEIVRQIGVADEVVYSGDEQKYFRKRCTFFRACQKADNLAVIENDHTLHWLSLDAAICRLNHESQKWAVSQACGR